MNRAELLLHPLRLRIVQAFMGDRALTTGQLAGELVDVPAGSLYRHVSLLANAGVLHIVSERRVRGAVERTYMLRAAAAQINAREAAAMSADEHRQAFMVFVAGLLGDADRYLSAGQPDPQADGAGYRMGALWLSDDELAALLTDLQAVLFDRAANAPGRGRRRRLLYGVLLPAEPPARDAVAKRRPGARKR